MSSRSRVQSCSRRSLLAALLALAVVGCSQRHLEEPELKTPPPILQEPTPVSAEIGEAEPVATRPLVEPLPVPATPPPGAAPKQGPRPRQVLIDSGKPVAETPTLLEASRRAKARKATAGKPVAVITDENLKEFAARGRLTMAHPTTTSEASGSGAKAPSANGSGTPTGAVEPPEKQASEEDYWTERVRTLRQKWRDASDSIEDLEARAEKLRTDFYAADDPRQRDTRIKPAWDRALDQVQESRRAAKRYQEELAVALEEGRRAGALPGWLRAGIDLEPAPSEPTAEDLEPHDPREPTILEENPR